MIGYTWTPDPKKNKALKPMPKSAPVEPVLDKAVKDEDVEKVAEEDPAELANLVLTVLLSRTDTQKASLCVLSCGH